MRMKSNHLISSDFHDFLVKWSCSKPSCLLGMGGAITSSVQAPRAEPRIYASALQAAIQPRKLKHLGPWWSSNRPKSAQKCSLLRASKPRHTQIWKTLTRCFSQATPRHHSHAINACISCPDLAEDEAEQARVPRHTACQAHGEDHLDGCTLRHLVHKVREVG